MKIDKLKIESYDKKLQATAPFTFSTTGIYYVSNQSLTEVQFIENFNLILTLGVFYFKPFITINMNSKTAFTKYFLTDTLANAFETDNLNSLAFLTI